MWDDDVAVISVGAGPGGLAYAAATADAGLSVLIATPPRADGAQAQAQDAGRGWLPVSGDPVTDEYLAELATGAISPAAPAASDLVVRTLHTPPRQRSRKPVVETFVGSRLPVWAGACLASPFGAVVTTVDHWPATRRTANGLSVGVAPIGAPDGRALDVWMAGAVREREVAVLGDATLRRLVFEDGRVIGAEFDTPEGDWAVQATHGVALSPAGPTPSAPVPAGGELALVGLAGSRFVRLELVHTEDAPD
jgi:hypothetical protein